MASAYDRKSCYPTDVDLEDLLRVLEEENGPTPVTPPDPPKVYTPWKDAWEMSWREWRSIRYDLEWEDPLFRWFMKTVIGGLLIVTFPILVAGRSRTYEEHAKFWKWVRFINGEIPLKKAIPRPDRPILLWFMNCIPSWAWRHMPLKWRTYHLFAGED